VSGAWIRPAWIRPQWPAPAAVSAFCTTRVGGISEAPFDSFNLGGHVGDDPAAVAANRRALIDANPGLIAVSWLNQVHGIAVVAADAAAQPAADAQFTRTAGLGCAVMTADCLPVLFCDRGGTQVAAAHAGWRGLCAGMLEQAAATFAQPDQVYAWLGPAISSAHFEVGPEVREQFLRSAASAQITATEQCFSPSVRAGHFMADLYELARLRLHNAGITAVYGGGFCTYAERERFYSFRREPITGRLASLIYIMPAAGCA
jgi:YfiH family protein